MEKTSSDDAHIARMHDFSHSKSSLKRSTRSSLIPKTRKSRVLPGPSDAGIRKRVKFSDSTSICEPEAIRNGPMPPNEGAHLSGSDGAKTSEFKSFKRLLEKTARTQYFDKVARSDINLQRGKARTCMEASSNAIPTKSIFRRSSLPVQNVSSTVQGFLSSPSLVLQGKELKDRAIGHNGAAISVPSSNITPMDRLFHPSPLFVGKSCGAKHSGTSQVHEGTFSGKRSYLLQLAAGTCLQTVEDFLSNRSNFILEILQRLGIRRNVHQEKLQNPEQKMRAHQFPTSSNQIVKFCDNPQLNSCTNMFEQSYDGLLALEWDNAEIQASPYNRSLKTSFESKHCMSDLYTEKSATLLSDFDNPASTIELIKEFDCSKYKYTDDAHNCSKYGYTDDAHTFLNSPCHVPEVNIFPTDCPTYIGQLYKNLHCDSALHYTELFDLCVETDSDISLNSKLELNCSSHRPHKRDHGSFQADCILFNSCNSESFFQEEALAPYIHPEHSKDQFTIPLLEWNATAEQELPAPKFLVPKDSNRFTKSLYDTLDLYDQIGSSSFFDVDGTSLNSFTELQF